MKKLLIMAAAMMLAVSSYGQGQLNFSNRAGTGLTAVDSPVMNQDGTALFGATFVAQLYAGPAGTAESSLTPVGAVAAFNALAGYFFGGARTITGVASGASAAVQVRAWDTTVGATWEAASAAGTGYGSSSMFTQSLGGGTLQPTNLVGLGSFSLVPEPSTIALGVLGAAALLFARRRKA